MPAWLAAGPCRQRPSSCSAAPLAPGWQGAGCVTRLRARRQQPWLLQLMPCCSCRRWWRRPGVAHKSCRWAAAFIKHSASHIALLREVWQAHALQVICLVHAASPFWLEHPVECWLALCLPGLPLPGALDRSCTARLLPGIKPCAIASNTRDLHPARCLLYLLGSRGRPSFKRCRVALCAGSVTPTSSSLRLQLHSLADQRERRGACAGLDHAPGWRRVHPRPAGGPPQERRAGRGAPPGWPTRGSLCTGQPGACLLPGECPCCVCVKGGVAAPDAAWAAGVHRQTRCIWMCLPVAFSRLLRGSLCGLLRDAAACCSGWRQGHRLAGPLHPSEGFTLFMRPPCAPRPHPPTPLPSCRWTLTAP